MGQSGWSDPGVWGVIVAAVALVLSQLPPIKDMLRGIELALTLPQQISVWHFLGSLHLVLPIDIDNIGSRRVSITSIVATLIDAQGKTWVMPAQTYIPHQPPPDPGAQPQEYLIGRILLRPSDSFSAPIRFHRLWNEAEEETVEAIITSLSADIASRFQPNGPAVEAQPQLVSKAVDFFNGNFNLHKGNFTILIHAYNEKDSLVALRGYEFTLYESHIRALRSHTEDYKYGAGIYFPVTSSGKSAWAKLRPVEDRKRVRALHDNYGARS